MNPLDFVRQDEKPLYPKILWNRPVSRHGAGRLLLAGGHSGDFSTITVVHRLAMAAGLGEGVVALPDNLVKLLGGTPATTFVASSPSGSLGRPALGRLLELAEEADAMALGANLSSNSDSAMLVEQLLRELTTPLIVFGDLIDAVKHNLKPLTNRPDALVILTMQQVFKMAGALGIAIHIRRDGGLVNKLEIITTIQQAVGCDLVVYGSEVIVATTDQLCVTPINFRLAMQPALFYAVLSVFWLQNRPDRAAGLITGAFVIRRVGETYSSEDTPSVGSIESTLRKQLEADF